MALSLLTCALLFLTAAAFLLFFYDFQTHKERLTAQLASHLGQPVQVGEVSLSLRHGPALSFASLVIGSGSGDGFHLRADRLLLRMEWRALREGQLHFTDILLDTPELHIHVDAKQNHQDLPISLLQGFAQAVQIDSLTVHNGTVHLHWRVNEPTASVQLRHLHANFQPLDGSSPIAFQITGKIPQQGPDALVQGQGQLLPAAADWQRSKLDLELSVRQFQPAALLSRLALHDALPELAGAVNFRLSAHGSPAEGMQIGIATAGGSLKTTAANGQQLDLAKWQAEGRWQATPTHHELGELRLDFDGLPFTGAVHIERGGPEPLITGRLSSAPLPVPRLVSHWLPGATPGRQREILQALHGGLLQFDARFAGGLNTIALTGLQFALRDSGFLLPEGEKVEVLSLLGALGEDGKASFQGDALLQGLPLTFSGEISDWAEATPQLTAVAHGEWPAEQFLARLPEEVGLHALGQIPWQLSVTGFEEELQVELQADLLMATLRRADFTIKPMGDPGRLRATGKITPQRLTLRHGELELPLLALQAHGQVERQEQETFELTLDATIADLRQLRPAQEWLEQFQLQGGIALHYQLRGAAGKIRSRHGKLHLHRVGLHLGVIADLREINGQVRLQGDRAESVGVLRGKIGDSPATATMRLDDIQRPVLDLQVTAQAIRADELIFPSTRMIMRDVHGGLRITADGLDFQKIQVRLDGGTEAVVDGQLRNYTDPVLELQVAASYGNIDEVIALWQNPAAQLAPPPAPMEEELARHAEAKQPFYGSYRIVATVARGQLGQLPFEEARGEITLPGGDLLISPLTFQVGAGRSTGRILLTSSQPVPRLTISGAMENFDAAAIYNQLLKRRGVVSGTLRGDFHLQGELGEDFLASSSGGGTLEVDKGVLRRFRFISKVFSILNVAQIINFKAPDMADRGMPFSRLRATFAINDGVLTTEDLLIDSEAMNLSLLGDIDLVQNRLDLLLGVKPLGTVDRVLSRIPLAGWVLTGEEKALITAHFLIRGSGDDPEVAAIPISSLSETVIGIFSRMLGLPGKLIGDLGTLLENESSSEEKNNYSTVE